MFCERVSNVKFYYYINVLITFSPNIEKHETFIFILKAIRPIPLALNPELPAVYALCSIVKLYRLFFFLRHFIFYKWCSMIIIGKFNLFQQTNYTIYQIISVKINNYIEWKYLFSANSPISLLFRGNI